MSDPANQCPHQGCHQPVFRPAEGKLKAKTSTIILHRDGRAEMICARCGGGIILPLATTPGVPLMKGEPSRRPEKSEA